MAQAPTCGGIGADRASGSAGDAAASDIALAPEALTRMGEAVPTNGRAVTLLLPRRAADRPARGAREPAGTGDPVIELYDAAGALVVTDDDSGGGSIRAPRPSWPPVPTASSCAASATAA
jgi:hypothetical protein